MDALMALAHKHSLLVIEDAAESHGATYKGKKVGSFGLASTFSFYANKTMTTGEGGMVVTNNAVHTCYVCVCEYMYIYTCVRACVRARAFGWRLQVGLW